MGDWGATGKVWERIRTHAPAAPPFCREVLVAYAEHTKDVVRDGVHVEDHPGLYDSSFIADVIQNTDSVLNRYTTAAPITTMGYFDSH